MLKFIYNGEYALHKVFRSRMKLGELMQIKSADYVLNIGGVHYRSSELRQIADKIDELNKAR